jgi:hypothetical protein
MPIEVEEERRADGAYAHVRDGLEKEFELQRLYFPNRTQFNLQEQLDDVRAGRPVRVLAHWLPPALLHFAADVVVVHPNDRITDSDVSWAQAWLEEGRL